jgi:hypothetical protein
MTNKLMDFREKYQQIEIDKKTLKKLITTTKNELDNDINEIKNNYKIFVNFISFAENTHIISLEEWAKIKEEYKKLKKKITIDTKNYIVIVKMYGDLITYYEPEQVKNINDTIDLIKKKIDNIEIEIKFLQKEYNMIQTKIKSLKKHSKGIIINQNHPKINNIIHKIKMNYDKIKELDKNYQLLKNQKVFVLNELNKFNINKEILFNT